MDDEELERRLDNLEQIQNQMMENQGAIQQLLEEKIKVKIDFIHAVMTILVFILVLNIVAAM